jgi:predicted amidophosphoribosyltransferase
MCGRGIGSFLFPVIAAGMIADQLPQPADALAGHQAVCPNCAAKISPIFHWCPQCGYGLKVHPCAYCGNQIKPEDRYCPSCGAPDIKTKE